MNQELYRYASGQLDSLRAAAEDGSKPFDYESNRRAVHRIAKLAADVTAAVAGTAAERRLGELVEKYRSLSGPGSRFDEARREAMSLLAMGFYACELAKGGASSTFLPQQQEPSQLPGIRCIVRALTEGGATTLSGGDGGGAAVPDIGVFQVDLGFCQGILGNPDAVPTGVTDVILHLKVLYRLMRSAIAAEMAGRDPGCRWFRPRPDADAASPPSPASDRGARGEVDAPAAGEAEHPEGTIRDVGEMEFVPLPEGTEETSRVGEAADGLAGFVAACDAENLRGAVIIARCSEAFGRRDAEAGAFEAVVDQLVMHWDDLAALVAAAAGELGPHLAPVEARQEPHPASTSASGGQARAAAASPPADDVDFDRFYRTPLMGTKTAIMRALRRAGRSTTADTKHFDVLERIGDVAVRGGGKTWRVYVRDKGVHQAVVRYLSAADEDQEGTPEG